MHFKRRRQTPLIAGANVRHTGQWDSYWAKCAQPILHEGKLYVTYRGMSSKEWDASTPDSATVQGVSQIGWAQYDPATFNASSAITPIAESKLDGNPANSRGPVLSATLQNWNVAGVDRKTPTHAVMAGAVTYLKLGEWNDMIVVLDDSNPSNKVYRMFVSLFYTYLNQEANYYTNRGAISDTQSATIIALTCPYDSFPNNWSYSGVVKRTSGAALANNIGPTWTHNGNIFMLVQDGTNRRLLSCPMQGMTGLSPWGNVWQDRGIAFGNSTTPKEFNAQNMIVGRSFVDGDFANVFLPGSHMFVDWPSAIGQWRIPLTALTGSSGAISGWEENAANPVYQRGPNEGGVWALAPFKLPSGEILALHESWGILTSSITPSGAIGNATAKGLRTDDYWGLDAGTTHKHISVVDMVGVAGDVNFSTPILNTETPYRLRNVKEGTYLTFSHTSGLLSCTATPTPEAEFLLRRWKVGEVESKRSYYQINPYGCCSSIMAPGVGASGRREAGQDMVAVPGLKWSHTLSATFGRSDVTTTSPENFHGEWLVVPNGTITEGGVTRPVITLENRESSLGLTCEQVGGNPILARQRYPIGAQFEQWVVETV